MSESQFVRSIRSFVKREVRITDSQIRAIEKYWPEYGFDAIAWPTPKPLIIEIGFGNGESLLNQAKLQPEFNFLGIEVHRPGVGILLNKLARKPLSNIRVSKNDALDVLEEFSPESIHGIQIFFPDPWQKNRHHKRRLIQQPFLDLVIPKLAPGGFIHCATDWEDYAVQMCEVLSGDARLVNASPNGTTIERPAHRILSKFERAGIEKGHSVWDYQFIKPIRPHV
jgi:tRNA (guanine-N7-)-methyltransferase